MALPETLQTSLLSFREEFPERNNNSYKGIMAFEIQEVVARQIIIQKGSAHTPFL
jgi:hypothetical protein